METTGAETAWVGRGEVNQGVLAGQGERQQQPKGQQSPEQAAPARQATLPKTGERARKTATTRPVERRVPARW